MLTPDQITALRDISGQLMDPVVEYLIEDIARRVSEAGQLSGTAAYETWRAQNLGLSQEQLKKEIRKRLKISQEQVEQLMTQAAETGYDFDISRFPTADAIPFEENTSLQQILNAAVKLAKEELTNITQTMGFVTAAGKVEDLNKAYRSVCDFAFQKVITGAQDYNSAVRDATRGLAQKGIRFIDYASGTHTSVEAAVRRNIMSGLGLLDEQITQQNHDDLGCDGWEISAHGGCAPDHEPIQGKQYSDKAYTRLNNSLVRRIGTLNCGHTAMPIIMGVNSPQYTDEELEEFRRQNEEGVTYEGKHYTLYEARQRQRRLETSVRNREHRILIDEQLGDKDALQNDQIRLQLLKQEYTKFSKASKLPMQYERMEAAGFTWKHGKAAEKTHRTVEAEKKARLAREQLRKKNLQFIKDDATMKMSSGSPKKLENLPDEKLQHTINVDVDPNKPNGFEFHAIAPKNADMTKIEVMAGAGTSTPIRDLRRLYEVYDRSPEGWQKKSGTVFGKEYHYVVHWYEHNGFVPKDEIKLKGMKKNK